jgi:hypothetical protein
MQSTTTDDQAQGARKIVKAKRRGDKNAGAIIDPETGEEIEFEDDSDDLDDQCIDEQEVVHIESDDEAQGKDGEWEDEDGMEVEDDKKKPEAEKKKKKKKKSKAEKAGADVKQEEPAIGT